MSGIIGSSPTLVAQILSFYALLVIYDEELNQE
jgi:hypothetical protein